MDQATDVLRHARPLQRRQLVDILVDRLALLSTAQLAQFFINQVPHGGPYNPRRVGIDGDTVVCHLHRESLRKPSHGPLRRAVVTQKRKGLEGDDARTADELVDALVQLPLLDHLLGGDGVAIVHAEDVDAEHAFDVFFSQVQQGFYLRDAGIGDHCVEGSQSVDGLRDEGFDFGALRDVGDDADGLAACLLYFGNDLTEC